MALDDLTGMESEQAAAGVAATAPHTGNAPAGTAGRWQPAAGGPPPPPAVTLPKGGGAIRGIGEKFTASAATGTGTLTIPVPASRAGRVSARRWA